MVENYDLPKRKREPFNKEVLQVIKKDIQKPYMERSIQPQAIRAFKNFRKYWKYAKENYNIKPLYSEVKVYSTHAIGKELGKNSLIEPYAGTVDLLAIIEENETKYVAFIDWKSGKYYDEEKYPLQLSAYREAVLEMNELGKLPLPDLPFYPYNICVLLGDIKPEIHKTKPNFAGWVKKWLNYKKPSKTCDKKSCYFCGDIIRCDLISNAKKSKIFKRLGYLPKNPHIIMMREKEIF